MQTLMVPLLVLWGVLTLGGLLCALLGLFVLFHVFRNQRPPADASNRINKIRLLWFCLTREELFVNTFPWLKNDELDNLSPKA